MIKSKNSLLAILYRLLARAGAATLPVVLIISAIIMEVAITSVLVAGVFGSATFNSRIASESLSAAEAGANDGMLKVIRYCPIKSVYYSAGCVNGGSTNTVAAWPACPPGSNITTAYAVTPYSVSIGSRTASVIIEDNPDCSGNKIIISTSSILNRVKRIEARLTTDQTTGETNIMSFKECYNYDSAQQLCVN